MRLLRFQFSAAGAVWFSMSHLRTIPNSGRSRAVPLRLRPVGNTSDCCRLGKRPKKKRAKACGFTIYVHILNYLMFNIQYSTVHIYRLQLPNLVPDLQCKKAAATLHWLLQYTCTGATILTILNNASNVCIYIPNWCGCKIQTFLCCYQPTINRWCLHVPNFFGSTPSEK